MQADHCRGTWTDYTALLRTRLIDLNTQGKSEQVDDVDGDVVKEVESAVAAYERSARVPNSVLEAAIFRKPYFIGKFLPVLLKPRARAKEHAVDVKEKLIVDLKESGKLSASLYDSYVAGCCLLDEKDRQDRQDRQDRVDEVAMDGLPELQQLDEYRHLLREAAQCCDPSKWPRMLDDVYRLLRQLTAASAASSASSFHIDLQGVDVNHLDDEICCKVLLFVSRFSKNWLQSSSKRRTAAVSQLWPAARTWPARSFVRPASGKDFQQESDQLWPAARIWRRRWLICGPRATCGPPIENGPPFFIRFLIRFFNFC